MAGSTPRVRRADEPEVRLVFQRRATIEILLLLDNEQPVSFGEFCLEIPGIAKQVISQRLHELRGIGVIRREVLQSGPPTRTQYWLTEDGKDLARIARDLSRFGEK